MRRRLIAVAGQTASGKSELALALAERLHGEIICADSRQFYRGMDIGTAKPPREEQARVPHHLFDIADPGETVGLGRWLELAHGALETIWSRGHVPFLVGGTGQYVWALLEGWDVPSVPGVGAWREAMERRAREEGPAALHAELAAADPAAAARIDPHNVRRTIRALEVFHFSGRRFSEHGRTDPDFAWLAIGIDLPRVRLYQRIDERARAQFAGGLLEEAARLVNLPASSPAPTAIGYREAAAYLRGESGLERAIIRTQQATHRLARAQATWFRKDDARIHWLTPENLIPGALELCRRFLEGEFP